MLGEYFDDFENVVACFMGDKDYPEYDNHIFLLCRRGSGKEYSSFKRLLKKTTQYVKLYSPDNFHDMFVFKVPEKYLTDYRLFTQSKYSQLTPSYKEQILSFYNISGDHSVTRVLYKDERLRRKIEEQIGQSLPKDAEVAEALNEQQEIYNEDMKVKTSKHNGDLIEE